MATLKILSFKLRFLVVFTVLCILTGMVMALVNFLRGYRNRDAGIPCVRCQKRAFPLEGLTTRYRCLTCGNRFDGPGHSS
jgi:hypothetical protein